ncbi:MULTISPECIES: NAD(P)-dependent oxidoreductase [Ferrimonas]|uniref:NAD(P)-dependent oxidoreductase n=1 Tax=Ferrimonas TaxID=44011 RepID=UPI000400950A|nr:MULTISPECIES: NAD(P)H-binding protein [Ferrimonas]USD36331.1 NAD(P)H-binding protein [Ferrimonas sp. SCSIO 43195]
MKLFIIGATGFVGHALVNEAVAQGHEVTALVRQTGKLPSHTGLTEIIGDVLDVHSTAAAMAGHDEILSAFNAGWSNPNLYQDFITGSDAIIEAAKLSGVRLQMVGGAGSLFVAPGVQLVDTDGFPQEYLQGARAARDVLTQLQQRTDLSWSYVSPPALLAPGQRTGSFRVGGDSLLMDGDTPANVSVEDLALAVVNEAEQRQHSGRRYTIGY